VVERSAVNRLVVGSNPTAGAKLGFVHSSASSSCSESCGLSPVEKWDLLQAVAQRLAQLNVQNVDRVVSHAYATRRVESTEAAKKILLNAESRFPSEAIISFNLACYECQIVNLESAKLKPM
jgi:hypothetical protein